VYPTVPAVCPTVRELLAGLGSFGRVNFRSVFVDVLKISPANSGVLVIPHKENSNAGDLLIEIIPDRIV
jgi:hypothetical protein